MTTEDEAPLPFIIGGERLWMLVGFDVTGGFLVDDDDGGAVPTMAVEGKLSLVNGADEELTQTEFVAMSPQLALQLGGQLIELAAQLLRGGV